MNITTNFDRTHRQITKTLDKKTLLKANNSGNAVFIIFPV